MEEMEEALRRAVREIDSSLDVQVNRIFGERKSAGFKIINENREKIASIDLSVRQNHFCRSYICPKHFESMTEYTEEYNKEIFEEI